jgi:hypothetical protein
VHDLEGALEPPVIRFVEQHVGSLLSWDIIVYFHRNPEEALDGQALAQRLGRRFEEVEPEAASMFGCILDCSGGVIRYSPRDDVRADVDAFVEACQDRDRRLALIALVLNQIRRPA